MKYLKIVILASLLSTALHAVAQIPLQTNCKEQKGGWLTQCLQNLSMKLDADQTDLYWILRKKISSLSANNKNKEYAQQFTLLLRKNELDFINYSESFCNLQNMLVSNDTEIDKMLKCMISKSQLRMNELQEVNSKIDMQAKDDQ